MNKSLLLLSVLAAAALTACGGGGGDEPSAPSGTTPESIAGIYENDALPGTSMMVLDTDGTFWSMSADRAVNPTLAGVSVGLSSVAANGNFNASGTGYLINGSNAYWSNFSVTGTARNDGHITYSITAFNQTTTGSVTRINAAASATGNIPSKSYTVNPMIGFSTAAITASYATFSVNGTGVSGSSAGCSFSGTTTDTGRGYSRVAIRFANSTACNYPNQTINGVATYDSVQQKLVFMFRMDPQPYKVFLGVGQ